MAKKQGSRNGTARRAAKKTRAKVAVEVKGKKTKKKPSRTAPISRPPGSKRQAARPKNVTTGSGATPAEIGRSLVDLFNAGKGDEASRRWWSRDIVSVEGIGMSWSGREAVEGKNREWYTQNTILGASADGPYVGASGFSVRFVIETQDNVTRKRTRMEEIGVYTVKNGQIVREEFMYGRAVEQQTA